MAGVGVTIGTPAGRFDSVRHAVRQGARDLARIWRGVMGEDAYERYREHVLAERVTGDPGHPLMTEREFWRDRTDRQDTNPQGRCC